MTFEEKDRIHDIKLSIERIRQEREKQPFLRIPLSYAEKFLKTYKKKLKPLEKLIPQYWDEPDKMYGLQDEYDELKFLVDQLEEYIKAMKAFSES